MLSSGKPQSFPLGNYWPGSRPGKTTNPALQSAVPINTFVKCSANESQGRNSLPPKAARPEPESVAAVAFLSVIPEGNLLLHFLSFLFFPNLPFFVGLIENHPPGGAPRIVPLALGRTSPVIPGTANHHAIGRSSHHGNPPGLGGFRRFREENMYPPTPNDGNFYVVTLVIK